MNDNTLKLRGYFFSFLVLAILGLGSLISWSISASYLVLSPFAQFIHRCHLMLPGPKIFLIPGALLLALLLLWLLLMGITAYRQHHSLVRFLRSLTFSQKWPEKLKLAVMSSEIKTPVDYALGTLNLAFSYGLLSQRIVVSENIVQSLELEELTAILLHEEFHSRQKDPLRIFLMSMTFSYLGKIKIIANLCEYFQITAEITADRLAMLRLGNKAWSLPSALLKIIRAESYVPAHVPGAASALESRIDFLINPGQMPGMNVSKLDYIALTFYIFITLVALALSLQHLGVWVTCHTIF